MQPVAYGEIVATVSSKSPALHAEEHRRIHPHHRGAIEKVGGARRGKAIIVINPAELPLIMRDTVHCLTDEEPDQTAITESIYACSAEVQKYVPGYRWSTARCSTASASVHLPGGRGPGRLPAQYAGNLDIMTAAAAHGRDVCRGNAGRAPHPAGRLKGLTRRGQVRGSRRRAWEPP